MSVRRKKAVLQGSGQLDESKNLLLSSNNEKVKIKVTVTNAPKANEVAFDKFAAYIDDNGVTTSDGYLMGYRITSSSSMYAKFYHRYGSDMVRMILDDSTSDQYLELQLVRGASRAYVYYSVYYRYTGTQEAEGYVPVASYRDKTTPGVFYNDDTPADTYLPLAFSVWRAMLRERGFGLTLYDLGFVSLANG